MAASLPSAAVLGARAFAALQGLNRFTDEPGKLTRLYLSPAHRQAAEWTKGAMEVAGLSASIDAAGSVQGRREGPTFGVLPQTAPNGRRFLWLTHGKGNAGTAPGTDSRECHDGFITVTPLTADLTARSAVAALADALT